MDGTGPGLETGDIAVTGKQKGGKGEKKEKGLLDGARNGLGGCSPVQRPDSLKKTQKGLQDTSVIRHNERRQHPPHPSVWHWRSQPRGIWDMSSKQAEGQY